jgi:Ser/Thr protein kinase RdoA (MazF antagonist)
MQERGPDGVPAGRPDGEERVTRPFPVANSVLSPEALACDVVPAFGVGRVDRVRFHQGGFNDAYRVEAANGSVYFLRVYRRGWRTREDALYELDVLVHLHRKGIPVAYPISKPDGSYLHDVDAPEGTRFAALFALARGRELSYGEDPAPTARAYGSAVAAMHNALDDFESTHRRFQIDLDHLIGRALSFIEPLLSRRTEDWTYLRRFARAVRLAIEELPASALERGVCHGDLQGYHANVDVKGVLTFFDFDGGGFGYRAYDLAVFRWCARLQGQEDARWAAFLEGYRAVRPIGVLDVTAVPLFVCARHIWHMGVHAENAWHWGYGGLDDEYYTRRIEALRELESDYRIPL